MKKSRKKWLFIIGGILIVVLLVIVNLSQSKRGTVTVQTKKVSYGDIVSVVSGSGKVQPKTKVNITSEVTAEIISIPVKEGDFVTRGQTLLQLDTVQLKKDMESALYNASQLEAVLEGAKVLLDQSRDEYERQKGLYEKKLTSEQSYKNAFYAYKSQEANYKATVQEKKGADSYLEKARDNLSKTTVKAPMSGIITWLEAEVGEIAQAQTNYSAGKILMILADLSAFEVEVDIDETDIADLQKEQEASVEIDAFPDTVFTGKVEEIGNTAGVSGSGTNDQTTNFQVKVALLENNQKLRPGMSATVDITTSKRHNVLTVPIQAIVMREMKTDSLKETAIDNKPTEGTGDSTVAADAVTSEDKKDTLSGAGKKKTEKKGVFVNEGGTAKFVEIETGIADQQNLEVVRGLQEGQEVVTGSFRVLRSLQDGDAIKVNNVVTTKEKGNESN